MVFFDINTPRMLSLFLFFFPFSRPSCPSLLRARNKTHLGQPKALGQLANGQKPTANRMRNRRADMAKEADSKQAGKQRPNARARGPGAKRNAKKARRGGTAPGWSEAAAGGLWPVARSARVRNSRSLWRRKNVSAPC